MSTAEDYTQHWEEKFKSRGWGRYPPEDFVRFMGRNFKGADKDSVNVLEVGCGPGANLWFLHREGFAVAGIDISPTAIRMAGERLRNENKGLSNKEPDLRMGNFTVLPWPDNYFDVVLDVYSICANRTADIIRTVSEIARVLKPGGFFYSKVLGTNTTGFGTGTQLEPGTFDNIACGPFSNMRVAHFFEREEIVRMFGQFFTPVAIDIISRTDQMMNQHFEEFHCQFKKAK